MDAKTIFVATGRFHWTREYFMLPVEVKSLFQWISNSFSLPLDTSTGRETHLHVHEDSFTPLCNQRTRQFPVEFERHTSSLLIYLRLLLTT